MIKDLIKNNIKRRVEITIGERKKWNTYIFLKKEEKIGKENEKNDEEKQNKNMHGEKRTRLSNESENKMLIKDFQRLSK